MIFYGISKELVFKPDNTRAWLDYLEKNNGKKLVVEIELEKSKRSLSQNNYLWGVVYKTIADYNGDTEQALHNYFVRTLLPPKFIKVMGKEIKVPSSTTELNKVEFGEYIEKIRAEVAHMVVIPEANNKEEFDIQTIYPQNNGEVKF